ncbi:OmpA family protein [Planobispora rosea]|uniref:OmpA family protein n=1 Tax=Planobispora rosea TaxID=35762 RepID=UPI00083B7541|nr:OmpA family protein [Planobispora rosea]
MLGARPLSVGKGVTVELLALDRVSPQRVVARWRLRNDLDRDHEFGATLTIPWNTPLLHSNSIGGVSLVDGKYGRRHLPLGYVGGDCLCTRSWPRVKAHSTYDLVAVFPAPPADVTHVDVLFGPAPPFLDIPLGTAPPEPLRVTEGSDEPVDPLSAGAGEPQVLRLVNQVEETAKARDDDGERVSVRLSADVLFAVDKAELDPRARAVLKEVASEIDQSGGDTVTIEGHADTTGTDAVNDPLSARRARSVETALRRLVTRSGLTYRSRGYGSRRPIAPNNEEEGRRLNRRVTVIFTRPRPAGPGNPSASPTASAPVSPSSPSASSGAQASTPPPGANTAELPVLATASAGTPPWIAKNSWPKRAEVDINELRCDAGGYVTLTWTIRNDDDATINAWSSSYDWFSVYAEASTSAAALVSGERRYRAVRDADHNSSLGPNLLSTPYDQYMVEKGEQYTLWAMFKPPAGLSHVTVQIPGFEPVPDVPIS